MKKVLLGTDIILLALHSKEELGTLEYILEWMARIKERPYIDISSVFIMFNTWNDPPSVLFRLSVIKDVVLKSPEIKTMEKFMDTPYPLDIRSQNPEEWKKALAHLALLQAGKVDLYITDSLIIHAIAKKINLDHKVYSINTYLERCSSGYRDKDPNKGLKVKAGQLGNLNLNDSFFDSFKSDYKEYLEWFERKKEDLVYFSKNNRGGMQALLKLKIENDSEEFSDVVPLLPDERCLKVSSFKVNVTGSKLAERFMRLIFNEAIKENVNAIYVTIYNTSRNKQRLVSILESWGFNVWGNKLNSSEIVLRRDFKKTAGCVASVKSSFIDKVYVKEYFPFHSPKNGVFIIPLHSAYLDLLLGHGLDDIDTDDIIPYRNAISKIIILKENLSQINPGAILLFYRMTHIVEDRGIVAVGIVERVKTDLRSETQFLGICRKRSGFSISHLKECWKEFKDKESLSLLEFLFVEHLNIRKFNEKYLNNCGIDTFGLHSQTALPISIDTFKNIFKNSDYERNYVAY